MPKKKNEKKDEKTIVQNIVIRPIVRTSYDVEAWRNALKAAEATVNPLRVRLYDLYADILLDAALSNLVEKRILNVTKTQLRYYSADGEEVPEMSYLIDNLQFFELREEIMQQKFWGVSLLELSRDGDVFSIYSIPRKHIRPDLGKIVWEQLGNEGIYYRDAPLNRTIVEVGKPDDLGKLLKAAPYVIYKRGGFGDWSKFAELFGMPFREYRYDGFNDAVRKELESAAEAYGSAPYAVLPREADFKVHPTPNVQGGGKLYDDLRTACNTELAILILGQTETTMSSTSSGYAQSKTHAQTEDDINADDRKFELAVMNEKVAPVLANLGYPIVQGGYFGHEIEEVEDTKSEQANVLISLKNGFNLPIDDDYLYEHFEIPKPDNYDELKNDDSSAVIQNESDNEGDEGSIPKPTRSKQRKRRLSFQERVRLSLRDFFVHAPASH